MSTTIEKVRVRVFDGGLWQLVNGVVDYIPETQKAIVVLPLNLTLPGLINYLSRKLNLPDFQNRFKLTYKSLSSGSIVELIDTNDARNFLAIGLEISPEALRLYVCDRVAESNQSNPCQDIVSAELYGPDHPQYILPLIPYEPNQSESGYNQYILPLIPYQPFQTDEATPSTPYHSYQTQYQPFETPNVGYQSQYHPFQSQGMYETPFQSY